MTTQSGLHRHRVDAFNLPRFGGGSTSTTTQKADPWSGQQPYLKDIFSEAQGLYNAEGPSYYPNSTVTPFTADQKTAFDQVYNFGMGGGSQAMQGAVGNVADTLSGNYLMAGNPYFSAMSDRIASEVMPRVNSTFEAAGRGDSGLAARAAAMGLGDAIGGLAYQNYGTERGNQMTAAGLAPGIDQGLYSGLNAATGAAGMYQQLGQQQLNDMVNRWNYDQNLDWNKLGNYSQMVQGNYGGTTTSSSTQPSNPLGTFGSLLSMGLGIANLSDRRAKENIRRIGAADNGLPIYVYNYIGDPIPRIGFMADEVEMLHPEAVSAMGNGLKGVNYALAVL
jgi:hypothetical protein